MWGGELGLGTLNFRWDQVFDRKGSWDWNNEAMTGTLPLCGARKPDAGEILNLYHGTRPELSLLIVRDGLQSSFISHGVIGAWTTTQPKFGLAWGASPAGEFAGCRVPAVQEVSGDFACDLGPPLATQGWFRCGAGFESKESRI